MPLLALLSIQGMNLIQRMEWAKEPTNLYMEHIPSYVRSQATVACYLTTLKLLSSMYEEKDGGSDN